MTSSYSFLWSHLGLNQGPPDYESGATNQLSYRTMMRKVHPTLFQIIHTLNQSLLLLS